MFQKQGVPRLQDYHALRQSREFQRLEDASASFIRGHGDQLRRYGARWILDPFQQWSRQWEYPFVYQEIRSYLQRHNRPAAVMDAGSGVTFFPAFLTDNYPEMSVYCCDSDSSYGQVFDRIYGNRSNVQFCSQDLRSLQFPDGQLDIVYCISVLEHTSEYPQILEEFYRILKPGGKLILTFDIALDGSADIPVPEAEALLAGLRRRFGPHEWPDLNSQLGSGILTTLAIEDVNRLPWRYPLLSHLKSAWKRRTLPRSIRKHLTCYCCSVTRPVED
jgi:ubiquinone/menaquinone biosynthesis C-methylase UbiE